MTTFDPPMIRRDRRRLALEAARSRTADHDLEAILELLRRRRLGASVLEVSREAGLGAVVVVPALRQLVDRGLVQRRVVPVPGQPSRSEYLLTASGRRLAS